MQMRHIPIKYLPQHHLDYLNFNSHKDFYTTKTDVTQYIFVSAYIFH